MGSRPVMLGGELPDLVGVLRPPTDPKRTCTLDVHLVVWVADCRTAGATEAGCSARCVARHMEITDSSSRELVVGSGDEGSG